MSKRTCVIDGCDQPHSCRGWCRNHYGRWQRYGDPEKSIPRPGPRFSPCVECGRRMRPANRRLAEFPDTVSSGSSTLCATCYGRSKHERKKRVPYKTCLRCRRDMVAAFAGRRPTGFVTHAARGLCRGCYSMTLTFGITHAEWDAMIIAQCGRCAVCNDPMMFGKGAVIDHDHATGKIRALLCSRCNSAEGLLKGDPQRARALADYIEKHAS